MKARCSFEIYIDGIPSPCSLPVLSHGLSESLYCPAHAETVSRFPYYYLRSQVIRSARKEGIK